MFTTISVGLTSINFNKGFNQYLTACNCAMLVTRVINHCKNLKWFNFTVLGKGQGSNLKCEKKTLELIYSS